MVVLIILVVAYWLVESDESFLEEATNVVHVVMLWSFFHVWLNIFKHDVGEGELIFIDVEEAKIFKSLETHSELLTLHAH